MRRSRTVAGVVLVAAGLVLTGCSQDGTDTAAEPNRTGAAQDGQQTTVARHNEADVDFATDMIPHHAQALVMSDVAMRRATDPELRTLARDIRAAQKPEITLMAGWLRAWEELVPPTRWRGWGMDGHGGMGPGRLHGPGMMGADELGRLRRGFGRHFDRMWLVMMIGHHEGAVQMSRVEQREGVNPEAKALSRRIERTQTAEIAQMRRMLRR